MSARLTQIVIVISALLLFVLLFIAPKTPAKQDKTAAHKKESFAGSSIATYVNLAQKTLNTEQKNKTDIMVSQKNYDSLSVFWNRLKRPDIASYFIEQKAVVGNSDSLWFKAGERYYYSVQFSEDKTEVPLLYACAMRCLNKSLALNGKNNDAKILMASCYLEAGENPMDGVSLLREVEKTDSANVKLQLAFAFFSVKSAQYDKAIKRFNKVLTLDSNYIEVYLHLADAYEQKGQTLKTIEMLQKYYDKTPDITAKQEIYKYIKQLKTNINK